MTKNEEKDLREGAFCIFAERGTLFMYLQVKVVLRLLMGEWRFRRVPM